MPLFKTFAGVLLLFVSAAVAGTLLWIHDSGSPDAVIDSAIYRSGQLSPDQLRDATNRFGVRTVVNLRGENPGAEWFEAEKRVAREEGLRFVSLSFETFASPPRIETLELVRLIDTSTEPILLHCGSGNDRSAWAAGVARILRGGTLAAARSDLSHLGGHFCDRDQCALHAFFDDYEAWLESSGREHGAATFREWVARDYYPEPYRARLTMERFPAIELRAGDPLSMTVRIENGTTTVWEAGRDTNSGIRPGARLLGPFAELPDDVLSLFRVAHSPASDVWRHHWSGRWAPGEHRNLQVTFEAPEASGLWVAQIDMVDENVRWFSDLGDPGLLVPFRVTARH